MKCWIESIRTQFVTFPGNVCLYSNGNVTQRCLSLFCTSAAMIVLLLSTPASATFLRFCMNAAMLHLFGRKEGYCINVDVCVCVY